MSRVDLEILGIDNASGVVKGVEGALGGLASLAGGALTLGLGAATAAFAGVSAAMAISVKEAMDAENNMALFDSTLKALGVTATKEAASYAAASGQFVESTKLSADEVEKLKQKSDDLEFAIRKETDALQKSTSAKKVDAIEVEGHQRALDKLKGQYDATNKAIEDGAGIIRTDLADALGLTTPLIIMARDELIDLSMALRDLAGGSDDAVLSVESVLLRFKLGKTIFPTATKAVLDLAAAMRIDAKSAAQLLGKALSTPGEGIGRLKVAGVDFTKQQEKMIAGMVAAGDVAGAQKVILDALAETTGGAAAAKAATFSGQLEIMRGHLLEVAEGVGSQLLPILKTLASTVMPILEVVAGKLAASFTVLLPHFLALGESVGVLIAKILEIAGVDISQASFLVFIMNATTFVGQLADGVKVLADWLTANLAPALGVAQEKLAPVTAGFKDLMSAIEKQMPAVIGALELMGAKVKEVFDRMSPTMIAQVGAALSALGKLWEQHGATILAVLTIAFGLIVTVVSNAILILTTLITAGLQLLTGDWEAALRTITEGFILFWNNTLALAGTNLDEFLTTWSNVFELLRIIIIQAITIYLTEIFKFLKGITAAVEGFKSTMIGLGASLMGWLLEGIRNATQGIIDAVANAVSRAVSEAKRLLPMGTDVEGRNLATNVNDAIISPSGRIITTSPEDYIVATKNPSALFGGAGGSVMNVIINVGGSVISEGELIREVINGLRRENIMNGGNALAV